MRRRIGKQEKVGVLGKGKQGTAGKKGKLNNI